mmetsp:Transcript_87142/g.251314  ORF Transcript_87142/g.251314 Transcript_87142/m.251314 type:complete len:157 (-) Transcript_87142:89-559(-)
MQWLRDSISAISPWNTQVIIDNQASTTVQMWLCRNAEKPSAHDAVEHNAPANTTYAINSGWLNEPRATILIRTGIHTAKVVRMPHATRLIVKLQPHGLELETEDEGIVFEEFPDPGDVPGHETVPMHLRNESFQQRLPAAEMPRASVARQTVRDSE